MIRFSCPTCKKILQASLPQAGQKVACAGCGQRLQVPTPARNKTVLGDLVPGASNPAPQAAAPAAATWYYSHNNQRQGPVAWQQLQAMASRGKLQQKDV